MCEQQEAAAFSAWAFKASLRKTAAREQLVKHQEIRAHEECSGEHQLLLRAMGVRGRLLVKIILQVKSVEIRCQPFFPFPDGDSVSWSDKVEVLGAGHA